MIQIVRSSRYKRERSRIDIVSPGLENSDLDLDPNPKACRWRDEVLILVADGANLLCQGCGKRTPTTSTSSYNSTDKGKPTLPKESKSSKLKQIDSLENKSFIITQHDIRRDRDRERRSEFEDAEDLSALNYFSGLYCNVGDY